MPTKKTKVNTIDIKKSQQPGEPPEKMYTIAEGCDNARSDARHDFHDILKAHQIQSYVSLNIPKGLCEIDPLVKDENKFLETYLINNNKLQDMQNLFSQASTTDENNETIFNKSVVERYTIINVSREQHNNDIKESLIQKELNNAGVVDDIFIICDVAYANVREDLTYVDRKKDQTFYWVQNSQTLYDPAGKTAWHTGAEYGFKDNESRFLFCWEDINKKAITYYPEWNVGLREVDCNNQDEMNKIIFTNKNLFLMTKGEGGNLDDYTNHEAVLIITDPTKPGYYAFADKDYAAKGNGILNNQQLKSYIDKGNSLKRFVKLLQTEQQVFLDEIMDYSPTTQVLTKKIGDASQSLSTNKKFFYLQKFKDQTKGSKGGIDEFVSNGNHAFVSFDRIAVATAVNYNAPIVVQNSQEGMIIYIRNDLITIENQLNKALTPLSEIPTYDSAELVNKINTFIDNFNNIKTNLSNITIPTNDDEYRTLLAKYFIVIPIFLLIKGINPHILKDTIIPPDANIFKTFLKNVYNIDADFTQYKNKLNNLLQIQIQRNNIPDINEETQRDIVNKGNEIQKQYSKLKDCDKNIKNCEILIDKINQIYDDIKVVFEEKKITELYNKIPKNITDNIKSCEPYKNAIMSTRIPRSSDAFQTRSTQYFGTSTIIIPIFNSLEINLNEEVQNIFVNKIKDSIQNIKDSANANNNNCFIEILTITDTQLSILNAPKETPKITEVPPSTIIKLKQKQQKIEEHKIELMEINEELNSILPQAIIKEKTAKKTKITTELKNQHEELKKEKLKLNNYDILFNEHNLLIPKEKVSDIVSVIAEALEALTNTTTTQQILNELLSKPDSNATTHHTESVNEIEIFLKGFLGIMIFIRNYEKQGVKIPAIFKKGKSQMTFITNFIKIADLLLFSEEEDAVDNSDTSFAVGDFVKMKDNKHDIWEITRVKNQNDIYIKNINKDKDTQNITEKNITKIVINEYNDNAFKNLIDMNTISFDEKPLKDEFEGYNANQFNFNKVLLLYLDECITTEKDNQPPSQEVFHRLFEQLFANTTILKKKGGGQISIELPSMVSEIINCFFDDKNNVKTENIRTFKNNMMFILNAPTINEIGIIIQHKRNEVVNNNFVKLFQKVYPEAYREILKIKPSHDNNELLDKIVLKAGPNMIKNENILPITMHRPIKLDIGGSKTRRHGKKISRNRRMKKNKSIKRFRKTRKS